MQEPIEKVTLYNLKGQKYLFNDKKQIDITGLPKGMYIIKITTKSHNYLRTIVINPE